MKKIVLTGGPCAGKTTTLVKIIGTLFEYWLQSVHYSRTSYIILQVGMDYLTDNKTSFMKGEKETVTNSLSCLGSYLHYVPYNWLVF